MPAAAPGLRERKKSRTRDALIAAAHRLFRERGFEATTVDEVAAAAEVSRRTYFRYFPTKEAVLFPSRAARLARFRRLLAERPVGETPLGAVRRACLAVAGDYMADRARVVSEYRIIQASPALIAHELELDLEWEDAIAEAFIARWPGAPDAERRARVWAAAAMGAIRATLREWFAQDGRTDLIALGSASLDWLERGMQAAGAAAGD